MADMSKREKCNGEFTLEGKVVFFATSNIHKFMEAREILSSHDIAVGMLRLKGDEIQSESLEEIAVASAKNAFKACGLPVIVEDAGLFIEALSGFPGPYAAYVYKTIHNSGILKQMTGVKNRKATFKSAIAYMDENLQEPLCFDGKSNGKITLTERKGGGNSGFGFDPIFQPNENEKTFAEMTLAEKNRFSHRADALRKFAEWYRKQV